MNAPLQSDDLFKEYWHFSPTVLMLLWASPFLLLILFVAASAGPVSPLPAPTPDPYSIYTPPVTSYVLPASSSHPGLFFNTINDCPGYAHSSASPWSSWQKDIISTANDRRTWDFTRDTMGNGYDSIMYRGAAAQSLGLAYQITKDPAYSLKAKEALLNIGRGDVENSFRKSSGLFSYSIAYDWVQPTLTAEDDTAIRDKLATLADSVYRDLNENGANRQYVTFHDYHGRAYIAVAMAGLALNDYDNPNRLSLSSGPEDWVKCGTDYYWIDDLLHDSHRSLASWAFEESTGKDYVGYNAYVDENLLLFAQAYSHFYGRNYFDDFPLAKKHFLVETWSALPNDFSANFETITNVMWQYEPGIISLLDEDNKSYALNRYDRLMSSKNLLQYPAREGGISIPTAYLTVDDYSSVPRQFPAATTYLNNNSVFQVFRQSWNNDSEWLSLRTFYPMEIENNRVQARADQLGFEYYGKGDLLLADGCEDKHVLNRFYAMYENYHNTIAIEDPRSPFNVSTWADSPARGIYKGQSGSGIATPSNITFIAQTPWMEALGASVNIQKVQDSSWTKSLQLSSDIGYERCILFPGKDYFIIIDRFESSQPWVYRNIFRPTSLRVTPTDDHTNDRMLGENDVGHVNGDLTIGAEAYDWLSLPYKDEIATGINTSVLTWSTTNPYGRAVELQLYSVPASNILVTKHVGRIGSSGYEAEVYSPVVYYRSAPQTSLYRATVLLSSYSSDVKAVPEAIAVNGNGNALKVTAPGHVDHIYTGKGLSTFGKYSTDADTAFIRDAGSVTEYTMINGTFISSGEAPMARATVPLSYITLKQDGGRISFNASSTSDASLILYGLSPSNNYGVTVDGYLQDSRSRVEDGALTVRLKKGEHAYEISAI
jgi:hypothetical protein